MWWGTVGAAVVLGRGIGAAVPSDRAAVVVVGSVVFAVVLGLAAVVGARLGVRPRWGRRGFLGAIVVLALARGVLAGDGQVSPWRETSRGPAAGLREFTVLHASVPGGRCQLQVAPTDRDDNGHARDSLLLSVPPSLCPRAAGDRVWVDAASLSLRQHPRLPGDPAPRQWARARGATAVGSTDSVWLAHRGEGVSADLSRAVARLRHAAWQASRGDPGKGFVVASSLGLRRALPGTKRRELQAAGLGHLVAVSGLHVAIAAWFAARVALHGLGLIDASGWLGLVAVALLVAAYVSVTGAPPSAVRAATMALLAGLGDVLGRPAHGMLVLVATSAMMLLFRPAWAGDPGFQLSVVAMAVLVRSPPGAGLLLTSWRVTWAIVPVAVLHFGRVGAYAVVTNLVAVPVATLWTLPLGIIGAVVTPWLGADALVPAAWGARTILAIAETVAQWPPLTPMSAAVVATGSLVLSVVASTGGAPRSRQPWRVAVRRCAVPPIAAVAVVLVAVVGPAAPATVPAFDWLAVGTPQRFSVVVAQPQRGTACIVDSVLPASKWPRLLAAIGVDRVSAVVPARPRDRGAPHLVAAEQALGTAGLLDPTLPGCTPPDRTSVAAALRRCRRQSGPGRGVVLLRRDASPRDAPASALPHREGNRDVTGVAGLTCFVHGRFVAAQPHSAGHAAGHEVD